MGIALGEPVFVTRIDPSNNDVVLGKKESLARQVFEADEANWLVDDPHHLPSKLGIQIRYNGEPKPGRILLEDDLTRFKVEFDRPELAVRRDRQPLSTMDLVFSVVVGFADQVNLPKRQTTPQSGFSCFSRGSENRQTSCKTIGLEKVAAFCWDD